MLCIIDLIENAISQVNRIYFWYFYSSTKTFCFDNEPLNCVRIVSYTKCKSLEIARYVSCTLITDQNDNKFNIFTRFSATVWYLRHELSLHKHLYKYKLDMFLHSLIIGPKLDSGGIHVVKSCIFIVTAPV